jgi:TolB-like protein/DNA-binding SARP family transcriptional activator
MPGLRVSILGPFELTGPDGRVPLTNKKLAALLAYLACTAPSRHGRDKLMTMLWGSHFDAQARQNLRQTLARLRRTIGPEALVVEGETVSLREGAVACDATRFETLLREGSREALAEAAGLYRDRFLADIVISEEAWTEWADAERQRLESLALDAMIALGDRELELGEHARALAAARRANAISSLREDAHRLAMRALAAGGRRADALKHYDDLAALLRRELAVEPDPSTKALVADLRQSHAQRTGTEGRSARPLTPSAGVATLAEPLALPDQPSIAVLPFANMSGDPEQEYFADGMVDDILTALSRVRWLFVIARQSSFCYKGRAVDVQQVGRDLGVRYVVEGSVRKSDNRVRIVAQLIETQTGTHLWADRYEENLLDVFALQDEITARIVAAVETSVQAAEIKRSKGKPTESLTAYDLYLRALPAYFGQTQVDYTRAEILLGKAIEVDPEYAEALGTLTDTVSVRTLQGWHESWERGRDESCELADRALAAGPDNSTCVASAACTYAILADRFDEALDLANRALMLHPNSLLVRNKSAAVYAVCGEIDKTVAQGEAARRMNPLDSKKAATATYSVLSCAHYFARRFEESIDAGRRAVAFAPAANTARKYVASSLAQLGRIDEARAHVAELIKYQPGASLAFFRRNSFRFEWMHELHLEGLRKAGLREE